MFQEIAKELISWEWLKIIQTGASIAVAIIAYRALTTWKHKSKADRQTDFIESISDEIHNFKKSRGQPA